MLTLNQTVCTKPQKNVFHRIGKHINYNRTLQKYTVIYYTCVFYIVGSAVRLRQIQLLFFLRAAQT